eukprot:gene19887-21828_t
MKNLLTSVCRISWGSNVLLLGEKLERNGVAQFNLLLRLKARLLHRTSSACHHHHHKHYFVRPEKFDKIRYSNCCATGKVDFWRNKCFISFGPPTRFQIQNTVAGKNVYVNGSLKEMFKFGKCTTRRNSTSDRGGDQNENIFTIPNVLSLMRIGLSPVIGYCVLQSEYTTALVLLGIAGVSDLLDGFIARSFKNQSTVFGSMLDPVADKVLMSIMTISLTYANLLPVQLCTLIIGRDVGLILAVAYLRYKTLPEPLTFSRYFDLNMPTVQMKPTQISKYNTGLQLGLVAFCLAAPVFGFVDNYMLQAYWYLVGATTVISGLSYVANKDTFKVIKKNR